MEFPQALVAAKYLFYQMTYVDEAWCPYCITDALTHFATLGLVLPKALEAAQNLLGGTAGNGAAMAADERGMRRAAPEHRDHAPAERVTIG
jgi:hypothetical protein